MDMTGRFATAVMAGGVGDGRRLRVSGQIGRKAYKTGDVSKGVLSAGYALERLTQTQTPKGATL